MDRASRLAAKLSQKIDRAGGPSECWPYTGYLGGDGYGYVSVGTRTDRVIVLAHRASYESARGPMPEGLDLGHRCHDADLDCPGGPCPHRACCNPDHLEPQTRRENTRSGSQGRAKECKRGHEFTPENTYRTPSGNRSCRACRAAYQRELRAAGRAAYTPDRRHQ